MIQNSFYFIRHGETELNAQNKCCGGGTDVSLNETGRQQAIKLKEKLKNYKFSNIISSPMKRAQETTKLLLGGKYIVIDELREWNIGIYEEQKLEFFLPYIKNHPETTIVPEGESKRAFFDRVITPINNAIKIYKNDFLIVAHGGIYWSILDAFNLPYDHIENCQLARFYQVDDIWKKEVI